jgi:acetyltransferase-like isoleucine patch superfamily enzyme
MTGKSFIVAALRPLARIAGRLVEPARRAWAHARLATRIRGRLDPSVVVLGVPEVHGTGEVSIGRGLFIYPGLYLETQGEGAIRIGDRVVLSRGVHLVAYARIEIGEGAMIGEYASIRDANHRLAPDASPRDSGHDAAPVSIGAHAWIGRGAIVLPGVSIGAQAVVGANAVVTHDVPAGAIVGGVPARPLHEGRLLQGSQCRA